MGGDTSISWTDKTWNCIRGCTRVSEGCRNCYAERTANRFSGTGKPYHGLVTSKLKVISETEQYVEARWTGEVRFIAKDLIIPVRWKWPHRVFVNSMSDIFHDKLTTEQIAAIFGIMAACPRHSFQVLTKRSTRMRLWFAWVERAAAECNDGVGMTPAAFCFAIAQRLYPHIPFRMDGRPRPNPLSKGKVVADALAAPWPLPNVWLGVSVENQEASVERIPDLVATPAAIRFLSCEPLLGPIDIGGAIGELDWIIAGCESGPRARPCDPGWLRLLRDQCRASSTKFFLKQAVGSGEMGTTNGCDKYGEPEVHGIDSTCNDPPTKPKRKGGGVIERPYLDGKQWLEMPG